jgi:hypothetical protein
VTVEPFTTAIIHAAELDAVQEQCAGAVTLNDPVPPSLPTLADADESAYVQLAAACAIVNV